MNHYAKAYPIPMLRERFRDMLHNLRIFGRDEVAVQRMKIIKFYEQYGERATK